MCDIISFQSSMIIMLQQMDLALLRVSLTDSEQGLIFSYEEIAVLS